MLKDKIFNKNKKKKPSRHKTSIVSTHLAEERMKDAAILEKQRLDIQRELEEAMAEYSAITGYKQLKVRQHKVGTAPNDWKGH